MPLDEAMAHNIAPGSTAGLPGLVLSAGLTTSGLPVALANRNCPDSAYLGKRLAPNTAGHSGTYRDWFRVTAARTRVLNASSSISSPSWKSMARLVFPSRLELKRPAGSLSCAPLAKVIFTTLL